MAQRVHRHWIDYLLAIGAAVAAVSIRWLLDPWLGDRLVFTMTFGAVAFAVWYGGYRPAIVAVLTSLLACDYFFIQPRGTFNILGAPNFLDATLYLLTSGIIIALGEKLRRAQNRAEESGELVRVTFASIGDAVITTDTAGKVTSLNAVAETLTGWTHADALGHPLSEVFHIINEQTRETVENPASKVLSFGRIVGLANHTVLVAKDGTERPIDDSASPIRDIDGGIKGVVMVFHDVTERRRAQESLRESADQLRFALEAGRLGTWDWEMRTNRVTWSPGLEAIHGLPPGTFPGTFEAYQKDIHPDDLEYVTCSIRKTVEAGTPHQIEYRIICPDGSLRWVEGRGQLMRDKTGASIRMVGVCSDITSRKIAEESLRDSEAHFRTMADAAPVLIWMSGPDKLCTWFNKKWLDFVGRTMEQELGNGWAENVHPDDFDRCLEIYTTSFNARRDFAMEYRLRRYDGEYRWIFDNGILRYGPDGAFVGYIGSCVDITPRKALEEERAILLEREQTARAEIERTSRLKDEFLANLSHELRTPLNAIIGWVMRIERKPADVEATREGIEVIKRNARMQADLVSDLLDMSRIIAGSFSLVKEQVDLGSVVEAAINSVRPTLEAKRISVQWTRDDEDLIVSGDVGRLQQVMWNLLSNAVKFTPAGGSIAVTLAKVDASARIEVRDTGQGITPEFLPYVFERFRQADSSTTREHGGLGLGLTIAKQLVELHGGSIRAQSDGAGKGSTFAVNLPLAVPTGPQRTGGTHPAGFLIEPSGDEVDLQGVQVLVIDDDPDTRDIFELVLEDYRADVLVASSCNDGLELLLSHQPHVILCDVGMPFIDGYEFIRKLRASGNRTPAVAVTAFARPEDRNRALAAGYHAHVTKPLEPEHLVSMIAAFAKSYPRHGQ